MSDTIQFVVRHGYLVIFFWLLAEQAALPIPSLPLLLVSGALALGTAHRILSALALPPLAALATASAFRHRRLLPSVVGAPSAMKRAPQYASQSGSPTEVIIDCAYNHGASDDGAGLASQAT